eukprot:TRINITY_DN30892_c0_g1_i1.p1 TRINITY_DN30892_c0_g1~~TRINITY_DN30892_c0_g1_i1.p1  ORF type:complete len:137 (+),score=26.10 TRINITY_DN30892_c0_g1_i1:64-474(+)
MDFQGYHRNYDFQSGFDVPELAFQKRHHRTRHRADKPGCHGGKVLARRPGRARPHVLPMNGQDVGVSFTQPSLIQWEPWSQVSIDFVDKASEWKIDDLASSKPCRLGFWKTDLEETEHSCAEEQTTSSAPSTSNQK